MTTLLPILLALGMHPQLTPVPPSCFLQDHPPGVPCHDTTREEKPLLPGNGNDDIKIVSMQGVLTPEQQAAYPENAWMKPCGPQNHDDWCVAPEKAAAPDEQHSTLEFFGVRFVCAEGTVDVPTDCKIYNGTLDDLARALVEWAKADPAAPPKPKRKAKPVMPEMEWAICAYDGTDGSILSCAVDARFLFSPDQHPEGVGDSKQPAPGLMPVLTAIREDDLAYTVIILIGLGLLAWFVLRIGADIINAILGTGRK